MKKRNGFVSNSSSSSFIVNFGKKPQSKEELAEIMGDCSVQRYGDNLTSGQVVDYVWGAIDNSKVDPNDMISVMKVDVDDIDYNCDIYEHLFKKVIDEIQRKYWYDESMTFEELKELTLKGLEVLIKPKSDDFIARFEISDENSYWAALENGDIFRNCKSVERISNH